MITEGFRLPCKGRRKGRCQAKVIQTYAQGHRVTGSQEIFEKSSLATVTCFPKRLCRTFSWRTEMVRKEERKIWPQLCLRKYRTKSAQISGKTSVVSDSAAAARLLAAQLRVPWPLQHGGTVPYSPGAHRHALTPTGTPALSFRLIWNSFSLHKVLDKKKKKNAYI